MWSFDLHLGGKALAWFVVLDKGKISSFTELVETLRSHWDSEQHDEWIPHAKHARDLFSKETQNKDQVKAAIVQGLNDDISSMIDEASQENEYDDGPIYEDPEVLAKEAEEQKHRMSSPFQHTKNPYDIPDFWEHNDDNYEDNGLLDIYGSTFLWFLKTK